MRGVIGLRKALHQYNHEKRFAKAKVEAKQEKRGLWGHENVVSLWE